MCGTGNAGDVAVDVAGPQAFLRVLRLVPHLIGDQVLAQNGERLDRGKVRRDRTDDRVATLVGVVNVAEVMLPGSVTLVSAVDDADGCGLAEIDRRAKLAGARDLRVQQAAEPHHHVQPPHQWLVAAFAHFAQQTVHVARVALSQPVRISDSQIPADGRFRPIVPLSAATRLRRGSSPVLRNMSARETRVPDDGASL
jgi:hypothetical protein